MGNKDTARIDRARLHRFGDSVALHFPDTPTRYLSPALATALAAELQRFANDVARVPFTRSALGSITVEAPTATERP